MANSFLYSLLISSVVLAMTYGLCYRKLGLGKNVTVVIALAFALITFLFLQTNPAILANTVSRIALALIGGVVTLAVWVSKGKNV
jgi:hypothetical protein